MCNGSVICSMKNWRRCRCASVGDTIFVCHSQNYCDLYTFHLSISISRSTAYNNRKKLSHLNASGGRRRMPHGIEHTMVREWNLVNGKLKRARAPLKYRTGSGRVRVRAGVSQQRQTLELVHLIHTHARTHMGAHTCTHQRGTRMGEGRGGGGGRWFDNVFIASKLLNACRRTGASVRKISTRMKRTVAYALPVRIYVGVRRRRRRRRRMDGRSTDATTQFNGMDVAHTQRK